jgi:hypothetical protein
MEMEMPEPKEATEILTDDDIERVHGHANFGGMAKRRVVNEGLLKYAFGYHTGYTQMSILIQHGLIKTPKPGSYRAGLTEKGKRYLKALYGRKFKDIVDLADDAAP